MPSKTSKTLPLRTRLWKSERACAEERVGQIAREFALALSPGDRVFLDGVMGAGKTTFARALLAGLGVVQPPEGSPSFAIAHEYASPRGSVVHIDFYRLKHESEIEEAGIDAYFWERPDGIVISEWVSLFPRFEAAVKKSQKVWRVKIQIEGEKRDLEIGLENG